MENKDCRILIVDDIPKNIQVLGTILKKEKFQIAVATDGQQAINTALKVKPDIILLDVMMPVMDGIQACKKLKTLDETKHIPIIFLTAKNESEYVIEGFNAGAVDYVTKPFIGVELIARVKTHLELKFSKDKLAQSAEKYRNLSNDRNELLHILCHDLANPFISTISVLDILKLDPDNFSEELINELDIISRNGMEIINLVRSIRSIDDGKQTFILKNINLDYAVELSLSILSRRIADKHIKINVDIDKSFDVLAEEVSLTNSIINNLLTNAIKFSEENDTIDIFAEKSEEIIKLHVKDYGIGIPPRIKESVFDINKATTRPGTKGESGTGYGMPLVQKFVLAYGATIDVISTEKSETTENHGTEFIISFKTKEN